MTKFRLLLNDTCGVFASVRDHAEDLAAMAANNRKDEAGHSPLGEKIARWLRHGGNVMVEFDTDAGTATVVEVGK